MTSAKAVGRTTGQTGVDATLVRSRWAGESGGAVGTGARPAAPDTIAASALDPAARRDLLGLQKDVAEAVARHLVAAGTLVDDDPAAALAHARYARRRASRIAVVREAAGITAYHAGEWAEALAELRAARRMGGGPGHLAVMADIERALGRPERAIELARGPEARELGRGAQLELAMVVAGARRDLGELDAAVVALQVPELEAVRRDPWSARLFYAYADNLLAAGRESDALQWFVHAADADTEGLTDADVRIAELTGEPLADDGIEFPFDEEDPHDEPAAVDSAESDADDMADIAADLAADDAADEAGDEADDVPPTTCRRRCRRRGRRRGRADDAADDVADVAADRRGRVEADDVVDDTADVAADIAADDVVDVADDAADDTGDDTASPDESAPTDGGAVPVDGVLPSDKPTDAAVAEHDAAPARDEDPAAPTGSVNGPEGPPEGAADGAADRLLCRPSRGPRGSPIRTRPILGSRGRAQRSGRSVSDLLDRHDVLLADLDGTLYRGAGAVPGAVEAVGGAAARGVRTVYVTNNASRRPADVAAHLTELGFPAAPDDVVTSSQAAAAMLAEQLAPASAVFVVGTDALAAEVIGVGLTVTTRGDDAVAVVQGHSPDTGWRNLAEAAVALRAGAVWVACNLDPTLPTERGPLPGNGSDGRRVAHRLRTRAAGGGQARARAGQRVGAAGGCASSFDDRRSVGHRHRGRSGRGHADPARADRRFRRRGTARRAA